MKSYFFAHFYSIFFDEMNPNLRDLHVHHQSLRNSKPRGLHAYRHSLRDPIRGDAFQIELMTKFVRNMNFLKINYQILHIFDIFPNLTDCHDHDRWLEQSICYLYWFFNNSNKKSRYNTSKSFNSKSIALMTNNDKIALSLQFDYYSRIKLQKLVDFFESKQK